jgi:hypothetical protein
VRPLGIAVIPPRLGILLRGEAPTDKGT